MLGWAVVFAGTLSGSRVVCDFLELAGGDGRSYPARNELVGRGVWLASFLAVFDWGRIVCFLLEGAWRPSLAGCCHVASCWYVPAIADTVACIGEGRMCTLTALLLNMVG